MIMAQVLKHYMKFVFFLFISSQVQGDTETKLQKIENSTIQKEVNENRDNKNNKYNPYMYDMSYELNKSLFRIKQKIQLKLRESYPEIAEMNKSLKDEFNDIIGIILMQSLIIEFMIKGHFNEVFDDVAKDLLPKDQETVDKISFITEQIKKIENNIHKIVIPIISEHINNVYDELIIKNKHKKKWVPMIKVGEIMFNITHDVILTLIPDKKYEFTNVNHNVSEF